MIIVRIQKVRAKTKTEGRRVLPTLCPLMSLQDAEISDTPHPCVDVAHICQTLDSEFTRYAGTANLTLLAAPKIPTSLTVKVDPPASKVGI